MAHFAQINEENIVTQVIVVANQNTSNQDGIEDEAIGAAFCNNLLGGTWKKTSYNGNIRKNYAGIGYKYDETLDAFIPPQPFTSWILDETTCQWKSPIDYPNDGNFYKWNEETLTWDAINEQL
jgi:hypothetical protein